MPDRPKLRKLERHTLQRGDEELVVLRDPLGLSEPVAFPAAAGPVLDMLDGQRSPAQIRQSLLMRGTMNIPVAEIEDLVVDLESAGLLDGDGFRERWAAVHGEYTGGEERAPCSAGLLYPADPQALREQLARDLPDPTARLEQGSRVVGVVCPHQPPADSADILDLTLRGLPPADQVDAIVILATDHTPGLLPFTVTSKPYRTPLHRAPCARGLLRELEEQVPWIRQEEIRHRGGHSVELSALLLHHLYGPRCPPLLPVLCGQTALMPDDSATATEQFLAAMERVLGRRRVLLWATAELGHAGAAYGDKPLDAEGRRAAAMEERDRDVLQSFTAARPAQLLRRCVTEDETRKLLRPSGAAVLVTLSRLLPVGYRAELLRYRTHRPPGTEDGLVGVAGLRISCM